MTRGTDRSEAVAALAEALYDAEVEVMYRYQRGPEDRVLHAESLLRALNSRGFDFVALRPEREEAGLLCGAPARGGLCALPSGHNMGRADVPANHSALAAVPPQETPASHNHIFTGNADACSVCGRRKDETRA